MSFQSWNKFFLISAISFFIVIATFNFIVNPYNIFKHHLFSNFLVIKKHTPSPRMEIFYRTIRDTPTNIIMGTSRIGMLSPSDVTKYLGGSTKNMAMPGANMEEQSQYLLYMIQNRPVKNIVWSLDFCSFNPDLPNDRDFTYDRLDNSIYINNDHKIALISFQTTKNSFKTLLNNIKASDTKKNNYIAALNDEENDYKQFDHYNTLPKKEIDSNTAKQLKSYPTKFLLVKTFNQPDTIDPNLKKLQTVIDLCKKKNINIFIYTSPVSKDFLQLYKDLDLENTFKYWKKGLANITAYTDFCNYNDITENSYNFIDGTHIMPKFSTLIFAKIFDDPSIKEVKEFGKHIIKEEF